MPYYTYAGICPVGAWLSTDDVYINLDTRIVEGHDIVSGDVDVVVTDGFTGNVALKTMEGMARMLAETLRGEVERSWLNRLSAAAARRLLRGLKIRLDPRRHNGASLVGLQGIVIKSHGGAVTVETTAGEGAAFHLLLPRVQEAADEVRALVRRIVDQTLDSEAPAATPSDGSMAVIIPACDAGVSSIARASKRK